MSGRFCACVVLLSAVRFTVCQTLYSAMRGGESPELHALKTTLKQLMEELRVIKGDYWTGGTDSLSENKWVWPMTGKSLTNFNAWEYGEPNDRDKAEDCLELYYRYGWNWNDVACDKTSKFICEKNYLSINVQCTE